jgi:hypothetical protein
MRYKQKLLSLVILTGLLALIYGAALIFSPERMSARSAAYVWLESRFVDQADRIELTREETIVLLRRNALWYVEHEGVEYPARQSRVEDLLRLLSTRDLYPLRGSAASSHEALGLGAAASRIVLRGGAGNFPLLDLLIGGRDAAGQDVYLRKSGQDEVRSGDDRFSGYLAGSRSAWYNLRLFPADGPSALTPDMVQRITVIPPAEDLSGTGLGETLPGAAPAEAAPFGAAPLVLSRSAGGWAGAVGALGDNVDLGANAALDVPRVDYYLRGILDAEAEDYTTLLKAEDPVFNEGRILLDLGDGSSRTIRFGPMVPYESAGSTLSRRTAVVSGSPHVYILAEWTVNRIIRDAAYFEAP